jgi:hypothetical protein
MFCLAFTVLQVTNVVANHNEDHQREGNTQFDDSLMGVPGSGAAITGSDSVVCGGFLNERMGEIHCLRVHLDTTAFRSNRRNSNGIGNYGCGNPEDRRQQALCLRNILDGNGLAPGTADDGSSTCEVGSAAYRSGTC